MVTQTLAIAAGGAVGAVLRFWLSNAVHAFAGRGFPYGTLTVNIAGSLLMGFFYAVLIERLASGGLARAALLIGFLGAFTTFSTFSMETLNLLEEGAWDRAIANVLLSVALCLAAVWAGVELGRQL